MAAILAKILTCKLERSKVAQILSSYIAPPKDVHNVINKSSRMSLSRNGDVSNALQLRP